LTVLGTHTSTPDAGPTAQAGKPLISNDLIRTSDYNIVAAFGTEYRRYVQYYQMAGNIN